MPDEPLGLRLEPGEVPHDAFYQPEVTWTAAQEEMDEAFIDPDTPVVRRQRPKKPADFERVLRQTAASVGEVVVTGIGDDAHLEDEDFVAPDAQVDRHVRELTRAVERLGDALRLRGEAGLRMTSDMNRFEATLRAYCVGYLTRVREEEAS